MSDYLTPPAVDRIDLSCYQAAAGDKIRVLASDDIEVTEVRVAIREQGGMSVEDGAASKQHGVWTYRAVESPLTRPLIIEVAAIDRPGNRTVATATFG